MSVVPKKVFVSYRRSDSSAEARSLFVRLREHFGASRVFFDVSGIAVGAEFAGELERSLSETGALIVVIGPTWSTVTDDSGRRRLEQDGDPVRLEIEAALRQRIAIVPVLVNGAQMPSALDLPESVRAVVSFMAMPITHPNFDSDCASLIAALERFVGSPSWLRQAARQSLSSASDFARLPLFSRVALFAVLGALAIAAFAPGVAPAIVGRVSALTAVMGSGASAPLSPKSRSRLRTILAATEDQLCSAFSAEDVWSSAQAYVACGAPEEQFSNFNTMITAALNDECMCWLTEGRALTHMYFWPLEALSENRTPADPRIIARILALQAEAGWWPTYVDEKREAERAPLYVSTLMVIALHRQHRLLEDGSLRSDVERAVRRGAAWIAQQEPSNADEWADYPDSANRIEHPMFGGMALSAVAPVLSRQRVSQLARRWAPTVQFDSPSLFVSSDQPIVFEEGRVVANTYRHVPLTWEVCGAVAAWSYLTLGQKVGLLIKFESMLRSLELDATPFRRNWVQADASYCLRALETSGDAATPTD